MEREIEKSQRLSQIVQVVLFGRLSRRANIGVSSIPWRRPCALARVDTGGKSAAGRTLILRASGTRYLFDPTPSSHTFEPFAYGYLHCMEGQMMTYLLPYFQLTEITFVRRIRHTTPKLRYQSSVLVRSCFDEGHSEGSQPHSCCSYIPILQIAAMVLAKKTVRRYI